MTSALAIIGVVALCITDFVDRLCILVSAVTGAPRLAFALSYRNYPLSRGGDNRPL
ncbi:hypothetical protein CDEST_10796 [Colletotrichum destructivum]|uniref:Uncharacterized protein n=1 Tax=Colletotrichum destructivum TaxID=34406 RepID=A0AAX4IRC3_9PEZI|nr:hypothetical protein CDEST_10796 [Colletotrichum destructivum]